MLAVTSTPAHLAKHAFEYVLPSLPHTGFMILVHTHALGVVALEVVASGVVVLGVVVTVVVITTDFSVVMLDLHRSGTESD